MKKCRAFRVKRGEFLLEKRGEFSKETAHCLRSAPFFLNFLAGFSRYTAIVTSVPAAETL